MSICCVYKITSPTGRVYIGSTNNYKKRISKYKNYICKAQTKLYNSLRKHGFNNHQFEIVIECVESDLCKYERTYGEFYDVLNEKNLNLALPGYDEVKQTTSEETKAKLRALNKGKKLSEETKAKLRTANKGRKISEEQKQKTLSTLKQKKFLKIKEKQVLKEIKSKLYPLRTNYLFMCNQTGIFYTTKDISRIFKISVNVIKYYVITNQLHKIPYQLV